MITAVLGGGQLARMLALAGAPLGIRTRCLDPSPDAGAGHVAELLVDDYEDIDALARLADGADVCTFEFENVPVETTRWLEQHTTVRPDPRALGIGQDRVQEKELFESLGIGTAEWRSASTREQLQDAVSATSGPCIVKTRRLGYDGRGQISLVPGPELAAATDRAFEELTADNDGGLIVEALVPFERELSVIAVRGLDGAIVSYPLVENEHEDGILRRSRAPALGLTPALQEAAEHHAESVLRELDYVGVLAIELFEVDGRLLANEMAPRVHNSGHWTIEGSLCSQFENHLRAVHGLPLGSTAMAGDGVATMINLVGTMPERAHVLGLPGVHLHDYGKAARPRRKLGHATVVGRERVAVDEMASRVLTQPGR